MEREPDTIIGWIACEEYDELLKRGELIDYCYPTLCKVGDFLKISDGLRERLVTKIVSIEKNPEGRSGTNFYLVLLRDSEGNPLTSPLG